MAFDLNNIKDKQNVGENQAETSWLKKEIVLFPVKFGPKKKEDFYTEISVLLKAGITLKEALTLIEENEKKKELKERLHDLTNLLVNGKSFSEAIQTKSDFTEYEYYSIRIGEETGTLERVTAELGLFFQRKNEQRRAIISALTYPGIITITAFLVVGFMLKFIVPMFQDIFKQNNVELPAITRFIVGLSSVFNDNILLILVLMSALIVGFKLIENNSRFKNRRDRLLLRIPYLGNFIKSVYLAQFTQAVALLTASRVPVLNSIQMVKKMIPFYPLQSGLESVEKEILRGQNLSAALKQVKLFDNKMISLVKVAEETNQTDYIFQRLNDQYTIEVQQKSKMLSTVMEPFIIVFVGILVAVILIAMYLPMFKLSSVLG